MSAHGHGMAHGSTSWEWSQDRSRQHRRNVDRSANGEAIIDASTWTSRTVRRRTRKPGVPTAPQRARRLLFRLTGGTLGVLLLIALLPYALTPIYTFPQPKPFSGPDFFNPYAGAHGRWRKANFHAHSRAWGGVTAGAQPPAQVLRRYHALGYSVAGLSNYESIDGGTRANPDFVPIYEHGYNVWKVHQLVIGAKYVTWLDFIFGQPLSYKQYMLDRLSHTGAVIAIAHPWLRDGYPVDQLRYLTDYRLMEVLRQGHAGVKRWDAALSSGHPAWIIGDDDEHNLNSPGTVGVSWTMVRTPSLRRVDILAALRAGHTYAVLGQHGQNDLLLRAVEVHNDTLTVTTDPGALTFSFVGQNGRLLKVVRDPEHASYVLRPADTYVRVVVKTPRTVMYLNPVVRYDGVRVTEPVARFHVWWTWAARLLLLGLVGLLVWTWRRRGRRAGHAAAPAPARPTPRPGG